MMLQYYMNAIGLITPTLTNLHECWVPASTWACCNGLGSPCTTPFLRLWWQEAIRRNMRASLHFRTTQVDSASERAWQVRIMHAHGLVKFVTAWMFCVAGALFYQDLSYKCQVWEAIGLLTSEMWGFSHWPSTASEFALLFNSEDISQVFQKMY